MESDLHQIIVSPQQLTEDHIKVFIYQIIRGIVLNLLALNLASICGVKTTQLDCMQDIQSTADM